MASTSTSSGMPSNGLTASRPWKPAQFEATPRDYAARIIDWIARLASDSAKRLGVVPTTTASGAWAM
jgi:hypothetical protein